MPALDPEAIATDAQVEWFATTEAARAGASSTPFRRHKGSKFGCGIRVPGFVRWPDLLANGAVLTRRITGHNWFQ